MEKQELETSLSRIHEWIRAADQKVSILLAFQGVLATIAAPKLYDLVAEAIRSYHPLSFLALAVACYFSFDSFLKIFHALVPNIHNSHLHRSITFFGDISSFSLQEYQQKLDSVSDVEYRNDLVQQIHTSANIATTKHRNFTAAIKSFVLAIGFWFLGWLLLHILVYVR